MGDSDDEYDRRRVRDKFRGERSEYEQRRPRGGDYRDRRGDWGDRRGRDSWSGGGRDPHGDPGWDRKRGGQYYGRSRRDSEGGDGRMSPPMKRNRRDWDASGGGMMPSPGLWTGRGPMMPQHQGADPGKQGLQDMPGDMKATPTPKMMTFKNFLAAQEDNIDEIEAVRRFQEYKTEFKRTQLSDFFVLHKDEEWFKNKYHPMESKNLAKEKRKAVKKRLRIFIELLDTGYMDNISLDDHHADSVMKLLDTVAIKLEGGTVEDLAILEDKKLATAEEIKEEIKEIKEEPKDEEMKQEDQNEQKEGTEEKPVSPSAVPLPDAPPPQPEAERQEPKKEKKRKRSKEPNYEVGEASESETSESEAEPAPPGEDDTVNTDANRDTEIKDTESTEEKPEKQPEPPATEGKSAQAEEDGEADPGPPGVDDESNSAKEENKEEQNEESESSEDEAEHKREIEKRKGLGAYLAMMRSESVEQEQNESQKKEESEKEKRKDKGEKKSGKRDWEKRKQTGLGAFASRMGGEGNEDSESDSDSDSNSDDEEDEKRAPKNHHKNENRHEKEKITVKKEEGEMAEETKAPELEARQLHKTLSLFMRSVPPNISKADIHAVCKRYPGYLRVAMADPSPDRGFFRRGWVTFENNVNIKDVCWNLSNIRIKEHELNPVVNRDLSKRVRPISGITLCKQVVKFDIQFSTKLVKALDEKIALYSREADEEQKDESAMEIEEMKDKTEATEDEQAEDGENKENGEETKEQEVSKVEEKEPEIIEPPLPTENPLLAVLPQIAPESGDAEEQNVTGEEDKEKKEAALDFLRDERLMKALDKLLLYLRIVHSVDYYNGSDYPHEDEMPNRCGVLHIRGEFSEKLSQSEVSEWKTNVEQKLGHYLVKEEEKLSDEEVQKLGKKKVEEETETFLNANTIELAKDKWLCPLSGKKFRAKEFVKKHIFNKHNDKLEAVKLEVDFFNNYLRDPKRPQFPESSPTKSSSTTSSSQYTYQQQQQQQQQPMGPQMGWTPRAHMMMYGGPRGPFTPPTPYGAAFPAGPEVYNRGGMTYPPKPARVGIPPRDARKMVQYRDLDAPDDLDFF